MRALQKIAETAENHYDRPIYVRQPFKFIRSDCGLKFKLLTLSYIFLYLPLS